MLVIRILWINLLLLIWIFILVWLINGVVVLVVVINLECIGNVWGFREGLIYIKEFLLIMVILVLVFISIVIGVFWILVLINKFYF